MDIDDVECAANLLLKEAEASADKQECDLYLGAVYALRVILEQSRICSGIDFIAILKNRINLEQVYYGQEQE